MADREDRWESESLAWIHRIREERARSRQGKVVPMPLEEQKAIAEKHGLKFVRLRDRARTR